MRNAKFDGVMTALCTMYNCDGSVNADMVKAHTDFCIRGGVNTVLASAGSGQYVNMTAKQREDTIKAVVETGFRMDGSRPIMDIEVDGDLTL